MINSDSWKWDLEQENGKYISFKTEIGKYIVITKIVKNGTSQISLCKLINGEIPYNRKGEPISLKTVKVEQIDLAMGKHLTLCHKIAKSD